MASQAEKGDLPGRALIDYKNSCTGKGAKTVMIDDNLGPLVKETFELATMGKYALRKLLKIVTEDCE